MVLWSAGILPVPPLGKLVCLQGPIRQQQQQGATQTMHLSCSTPVCTVMAAQVLTGQWSAACQRNQELSVHCNDAVAPSCMEEHLQCLAHPQQCHARAPCTVTDHMLLLATRACWASLYTSLVLRLALVGPGEGRRPGGSDYKYLLLSHTAPGHGAAPPCGP